ncbi:MAG: hypothetical protein R3F40_15565 [Candidatus Competibacteraceae bacterium]
MEQTEYKNRIVARLKGSHGRAVRSTAGDPAATEGRGTAQRLVMALPAGVSMLPALRGHDDGQAWRRVWIAAISVQRLRQDLHRADRDTVSSAARQTKLLENAACMVDGLSVRATAARLPHSRKPSAGGTNFDFLRQQQPKALMGIVEGMKPSSGLLQGQRKGMPSCLETAAWQDPG